MNQENFVKTSREKMGAQFIRVFSLVFCVEFWIGSIVVMFLVGGGRIAVPTWADWVILAVNILSGSLGANLLIDLINYTFLQQTGSFGWDGDWVVISASDFKTEVFVNGQKLSCSREVYKNGYAIQLYDLEQDGECLGLVCKRGRLKHRPLEDYSVYYKGCKVVNRGSFNFPEVAYTLW